MMNLHASTEVIKFNSAIPIREQILAIEQQETVLFVSKNYLRVAKKAFMEMLQQADLAKALSNNKVDCMLYFEQFIKDACAAKALKIDDIDLAAKQLVYQLESYIIYPILYGFDIPSAEHQAYLVEQSVDFLARYHCQ